MAAVPLRWAGDVEAPAPAPALSNTCPRSTPAAGERPPWPASIASAVWRGSELGSPVTAVVGSGFAALDAELPGGGWPCHALTEVLQPQPSVAEWRLLAPAMRQMVTRGLDVVIVGPPKTPHLPGLRHVGLDERRLVWVHAESPAERLWATEQIVRANAAGLLVAWLPQARPEQIRRLQVCAQGCDGPVFLCRPLAARHEASAAPLRVQLRFGLDWELHLELLKRKGPAHEGTLALASIPGGLESNLTPRLRSPSLLLAGRRTRDPSLPEVRHVVGSPASRPALQRLGAH
jgi:protein ImuA